MKQIVVCLLLCGFINPVTPVFSQRSTELKIGDEMPDLQFTDLLHYKSNSFKISDCRDKILIIDFWATWCGPCLRMFPKMDSLQRQFDNDLQIMAVTYEERTKVQIFLTQMKKNNRVYPPSIVGDSVLHQLFKHRLIPHYVWVGKNGRIMAITGSEEVNEANIKKLIGEKAFVLKEKKDIMKYVVDTKTPAFVLANKVIVNDSIGLEMVTQDHIIMHSVLTRYIDGLTGRQTNLDSTRFTALNSSIRGLYRWALGNGNEGLENEFALFLANNRTKWEFKDASLNILTDDYQDSLYKRSERDKLKEWRKQYTFCYELIVPKGCVKEKFRIMASDLNKYFMNLFGIYGTLQKRSVKCLLLVRTSIGDKLATKGGDPEWKDGLWSFHIKNMSLKIFRARMASFWLQHLATPFLDETGYSGNVDLDINCSLNDIDALNRELNKYDLKLIEAERKVDMIIISDRIPDYLAH